MIRTFQLFFILTFFSCTAEAQPEYPSFNEIVDWFSSNYSLRADQTADMLEFSKTPKGYFVKEYELSSGEYGKRQQIWSSETGSFASLDFPEGPAEDYIKDILKDNGNARWLNLYPYFGYRGWEKDNIELLEKESDLTDDQLYSLGRSYSSLASAKFNIANWSAYSKSGAFALNETDRNQLNEEQIEEYRSLRESARKYFLALCERSPDYKTLVGTVCTKHDNEYLVEYLDIKMFHNAELASKVLSDDLYSDEELKEAKAYLNSCEENAILFTLGDMDTYPLLYIQEKNSFRKDVTVINISLLNLGVYANTMRYYFNEQFGDQLLSLKPENYRGEKMDFTPITDQVPVLGLGKYFELLSQENDMLRFEYDENSFVLPSKSIKISLAEDNSFIYKPQKDYLTQGELLILDIIHTAGSNYPMHFANNFILNMSPYTVQKGKVYKLVGRGN